MNEYLLTIYDFGVELATVIRNILYMTTFGSFYFISRYGWVRLTHTIWNYYIQRNTRNFLLNQQQNRRLSMLLKEVRVWHILNF